MKAVFRSFGVYCLAFAGACATAAPKHYKMEPIRIQLTPDPLTGLTSFDAGDLLERGNALFDVEDYETARLFYEQVAIKFPDSSLVPTARYNAALSLERLEKFELALKHYAVIIDSFSKSPSAKDAYYRSGVVLSKLKRWNEVEKTFWALRHREKLTPMDEIEARVGLAIALFMQREYATAEREFMAVLRFYDDHEHKQYLPAKYWIAQTRFYMGEIAARMFEDVELNSKSGDEGEWKEELATQLEEKCELLLRAQNNFIRAIREGHTGWATAAGFRIGSLYEALYDQMLNVPMPPQVSDEVREVYLFELQKRVSVLVRKAIMVYERSLNMAHRVGESNEWVERTEKALNRMKDLALKSAKS
jgi:TolA-binding protein